MGSMKQDQLLENACDVTLGCLLCVCSLKALHSAAPALQYLPTGLCAERLGQNAALQHGEGQGRAGEGQGKGRGRAEATHQRFTRNTCSISCRISSSRNTLRTSSLSMHCCLFMYFMAYIFSVSLFCTMHTCSRRKRFSKMFSTLICCLTCETSSPGGEAHTR